MSLKHSIDELNQLRLAFLSALMLKLKELTYDFPKRSRSLLASKPDCKNQLREFVKDAYG